MSRVFAKAFEGALPGEIYPVAYEAGQACPDGLVAAAESVGALVTDGSAPPVPPLKADDGKPAETETKTDDGKPAATKPPQGGPKNIG
jgi:hypothetical protein